MNPELAKRVPRVPNWRWVLWSGPTHAEWSPELEYLESYIKDEGIDVGLLALSEPDEHLSRAIKIYLDEPPIRRTVERMLYERCGAALVAEALFHKYKEEVPHEVVNRYRKYFYDVDMMNNYEVSKYYEKIGQRLPDPPPVPGHMRESYTAFKLGLESEVSPKEIMNHMLQHSFFRSQELARHGWIADDKVLKYQKAALDVIKAMSDGELRDPIPEEFIFEIEYPASTAIDASELDGYSPDEDPNEDPSDSN